MLFNTLAFVSFFITVFFFYWIVFGRSLKLQNLIILISSYVFYGFWDWRFLSLLILISLVNYILGYYIGKTSNLKTKQVLLGAGVITSLGALIYFKYVNFFMASLAVLLSRFHITLSLPLVNIILPLGISFFTFRTLGYLFDINRGKIVPTTNWVVFFSFVAFFPCLISGPIDKPGMLIPQLKKKRVFDSAQAIDGLRQILWGLFKKTVIADNCALITKPIFDGYQTQPASSLLIGIFFYTIQIYADFSGYSDMAIGIARLLCINVTRNFDSPFFSQNIAEFWRKWHISLTTWLTEYVFTPLSIQFRDYGKLGLIIAILINFTLIGIWHGPSWTFVLFGFLHGCYYIPLILTGTFNKKKKASTQKPFQPLTAFIKTTGTFLLVMFTFVLFYSTSISQALSIYKALFSTTLFSAPVFIQNNIVVHTLYFTIFLLAIEWVGRGQQYALADFGVKWPLVLRWGFYYGIIVIIFYFAGSTQRFIYFQF